MFSVGLQLLYIAAPSTSTRLSTYSAYVHSALAVRSLCT